MKIKNFAIALTSLITLVSCNKGENAAPEHELTLLPITNEMEVVTRSAGDSFFAAGDSIALAVTDNGVTTNYLYGYNNGAFTGINTANTYRFYMDDHVITTIKAQWPANRPAAPITDQRLDINFKKSDYLSATLTNVMTTPKYIPMEFVHENSKILFMVTGQNANGQAISSLVVNVGEVGYWAHPDPVTGYAELILSPGDVYIYAGNIAGIIEIKGFKGAVIFEKTATYNLKANTSYVVVLSPCGDNMLARVGIADWGQSENGVAVPLVLIDGYYQISNEAQLFAVAQLINNYKPDAAGVDWTSANYRLTGDITRSARPWVPVTNFTGQFDYNGFTITPDINFTNPITF